MLTYEVGLKHFPGLWPVAAEQNIMKKLMNGKGITLIELMIVVALIGVASALAAPRFAHTVHRLKVKNAARDMVSKMRLARSSAITNKAQYGVTFDDDGTTMTTFLDTENPGDYTYTEGDSILRVDSLPDEFAYVYACYGEATIVYLPNGSASKTDAFFFLSYANENVCWGQIEVLASTGRTKISDIVYY